MPDNLPMLTLDVSTQFKKDLKKISKQHKNKALLNDVVASLCKQEKLPTKK